MFFSVDLNTFEDAADRDSYIDGLVKQTITNINRLTELGRTLQELKAFLQLRNEAEQIKRMTERKSFVMEYFGGGRRRELIGREVIGTAHASALGALREDADVARFVSDRKDIDYLIEINGVPLYWRTRVGHEYIIVGKTYNEFANEAAEDVRGWLMTDNVYI